MDNSDSDTELFDNWGSLFIGLVEDDENSSSENECTIDLLVNQALLSFKIDFGAQANIVPGILIKLPTLSYLVILTNLETVLEK